MVEEKKLEREYIIPLRKEWLKAPKHKRAKKAIRAIREFLARHMKAEIKDIKIGRWLNREIWARGIKKPLGKVKIKAVKEEDIVKAELAELPEYAKKIEEKEKARAEKAKKEKEKKEEKEIKETTKEEIKEAVEEKEEKEKIIHKEIPKAEKVITGPEKEPHKTKPFRQSLRK